MAIRRHFSRSTWEMAGCYLHPWCTRYSWGPSHGLLVLTHGLEAVGWGRGPSSIAWPCSWGRTWRAPLSFFLFIFFFSLLSKIPTCRSFPLPTLKEPGVPSKSWAPGPPTHHLCAMDGGSLAVLCKASIIPLHAETLLFHSSKHCQSKSQEGLFLALFSIVT